MKVKILLCFNFAFLRKMIQQPVQLSSSYKDQTCFFNVIKRVFALSKDENIIHSEA
jgi:hypothetical protein